MEDAGRRLRAGTPSPDKRGSREIHVFDELAALNAAAAEYIAGAASRAIAERGRFLLVLAGGATPLGVYARLASQAAGRIDWTRVDLFWGDERCVPPGHDESNYGSAATTLLGEIPVPLQRVYRIRGEQSAVSAAAEYDDALAAFFGAMTPAGLGDDTAFDLVLLGIGGDGHTASLFPGSPALDAESWATPAHAPASEISERVTLTLSAINASRECMILVTGEAKRQVVSQVLRPRTPADGSQALLPAARIQPREQSMWLLDAAAAGALVTRDAALKAYDVVSRENGPHVESQSRSGE